MLRIELPDKSNKNTGHPVQFEFPITDILFFFFLVLTMSHIVLILKKSIVYLKFTLNLLVLYFV